MSLVGPGGCGKSAVGLAAVHAGLSSANSHSSEGSQAISSPAGWGSAFCADFGRCGTADECATQLARAFGLISTSKDPRLPIVWLRDLAARCPARIAVVLDNADAISPADLMPFLRLMLQAHPGLRLITTSRQHIMTHSPIVKTCVVPPLRQVRQTTIWCVTCALVQALRVPSQTNSATQTACVYRPLQLPGCVPVHRP